jgi:glycine/D-amino acid oxidase-like deaminating enzyme
MRHTPQGWWLEEAGGADPPPQPGPAGTVDADVLVVGGGYTGMWTAWHVLQREPEARVAILEAGLCGHGPSGRNGGFCHGLWSSLPDLRERFGDEEALRLCEAAAASVDAIGAWCEREGVDAWFRRGGELRVSTAPAQDGVGAESVAVAAALGRPGRVRALSTAEVGERCASPVFRGGTFVEHGATVQPARLALGLRRRLIERGAGLYEGARARGVTATPAGVVAETASGRVRAPRAVLAAGGALAGLGPLRRRLMVASSHIVLTEPVPDVLDELGWRGGEAITDGRDFLHYFRTTRDDRIAFGWAGGHVAPGARTGGRIEVDPAIATQAMRHLARIFPATASRRITHAWGGPIDIAPAHLPWVADLDPGRPGAVQAAAGYTGNGVGPSHLVGRILAARALDGADEASTLPLVGPPPASVPPEPLRWAGASVVRAALLRREAADEESRRADPLTRAVAGLPARLGVTLGR